MVKAGGIMFLAGAAAAKLGTTLVNKGYGTK